jgi:hypothetical protein
LFAATFAKLKVGLTLAARVLVGTRGDEETGAAEAGGVLGRAEGRSDPDREFVLDMDKRSRSLLRRSAISFSLPVTSTGLNQHNQDVNLKNGRIWISYFAEPKGFARDDVA